MDSQIQTVEIWRSQTWQVFFPKFAKAYGESLYIRNVKNVHFFDGSNFLESLGGHIYINNGTYLQTNDT